MGTRYGLSLIECLVALVLLGVGCLGILPLVGAAARLERVAHRRQAVLERTSRQLTRFVAAPCHFRPPAHDPATSSDGVVERWVILRTDSASTLMGVIEGIGDPVTVKVRRRC